jgi:hypothetical protein
LPYAVGNESPGFADAVNLLSSSSHATNSPLQNPPHGDIQKGDGSFDPDILESDHQELQDETPIWSRIALPDNMSALSIGHQREFTVGSDPSEREAILSSFIVNSLNARETSGDSAIVPSNCLDWPTTLNSLDTHNSFGFYNPSVMPAQTMMQPQPYPCIIPGGTFSFPINVPAPQRAPCPLCTETFARSSDLNRHWQSVHLGIKYHCDYWAGCPNNGGKGYYRLEKLRAHQREKYGFAWS